MSKQPLDPFQSIHPLSLLIQEQLISPVDLVHSILERVTSLNPTLSAYITIASDQALEQAQQAESEIKSGQWRGPLHGIPVAVKDFYDTAGIRTTAAFEYFGQRVPAHDATAVRKLKDAGAIIIGKTNMHTLGMGTTGLESYFGAARNPWNSAYIPGGSSSGSAVAVASGMSFATLDTDAIGSCRLPAACCGVVGFKGTFGLINMQGILDGEQPPDETILWLSHAGITARNVKDIALLLDVLAERNEHTPARHYFDDLAKERRLRIGKANNFTADSSVAASFEQAVASIRNLGHSLTPVAVPFGDPNQGIVNIAADRAAITERAFKDVDVILLPTTPTTTPSITSALGNPQALSSENTAFANYYGLPAISVPNGFDEHGLPLGLQIVGKPMDDSTVLYLAHEFQCASELSTKHPVV